LFTENETNNQRLFAVNNASPYVKDGINNYVVNGEKTAVNPNRIGTKFAARYELEIGAGETKIVRLRLSDVQNLTAPFGTEFETIWQQRQHEADEFYQRISPLPMLEDRRNVQRQAFA
ncbi:MAG: MGH1-like glycoside hydrolase domain-containing protein, partial [Nostoc sp.]